MSFKSKIPDIIIFILSITSLIISLVLFYNMAIFCDEFNTTPAVVCGGEAELLADWGRLFFLALICLLSFINLFKKENK